MSKLNIDQKNIKSLFSDKKSDFLIPDYLESQGYSENDAENAANDYFKKYTVQNYDEKRQCLYEINRHKKG